jgi:uncharacterized protein (DUF1800 family)
MPRIKRRVLLKGLALLGPSAALAACANQQAAPILPSPTASRPVLPATSAASQPTRLPAQLPDEPVPAEPPLADPAPDNGTLPPAFALAAHRLGFGPRPGDREHFLSLGEDDDFRLAAWIDEQLSPDRIDDAAFEARFADARFETLEKPLETLADEHIVNNPYDPNDDLHWHWYVLPTEELVEAAFLRAAYSRRQLQEMLVDFWHNHFNVYGWQDEVTPLHVAYDRDVIRRHLFGNFREFLEDVAAHPAMLFYLNNRSNSDAGPNENFARELFELHTLGAENYLGVRDPRDVSLGPDGVAEGYVDNDVYEAARCFTGWRVEDDQWEGEDDIGASFAFRYYPPWHDRFNKLVLGRYIPPDQPDQQDGRDVLDMLAAHPGTARFIARKLCRRFIADEPPERAVETVAQAFLDHRAAPDQLRRVYQALFAIPDFRQSWGAKLKRPFELAVSVLRGLDIDFTRVPGGARWIVEMMGQPVFGRHPPDGYPDTAPAWANTMVNLYGWNMITSLAQNWWSEEEDQKNARVDLPGQIPTGLRLPGDVMDYWIDRLALVDFPHDSRQAVVDFLTGDAPPGQELSDDHLQWRLPAAVELLCMSPEFRFR